MKRVAKRVRSSIASRNGKVSKSLTTTKALTRSKTSELALVVRRSKIPAAGQGLFAAKRFSKGELLPIPYKGKRLTQAQFDRLRDHSYCMMLHRDPEHVAIDAKRMVSNNLLRYVNGARTSAQRRRVNVVTELKARDCWFKTTKVVAKGEEFVLDYGPDYWWCLKHNTRLAELKKNVRQVKETLRRSSGSTKRRLEEELATAIYELEDFIDTQEEKDSMDCY
eukprot:gnl/MRDRNA2_/MRDRNA2_54398_c0_seq1.p1 gnl/MRDRNA2_/MRDRNA2_54398_c0~~gnl/MRDRNA2_/MRDRNA2_54398_c0_seq1.p1  ORF type:complete len:222 (-),score=34.33 gnl/MRDRNA2_/MRDRNA2_54398_c0_seq1:140-805(-)